MFTHRAQRGHGNPDEMMRSDLKRLLLVATMMAAMLAGPVQAVEPVKIGMITTLSTKAGYLGEEIRDGFQLAIDQEEGRLGGIAGEVYTKLGQSDYAAEIAALRAAKPDAVFFFLPGGMGINFVKQFAQAGLNQTIPVFGPAFSFDERLLQAVKEAALGVKNGSQWTHDLDNPANRQFVAAFKTAYGRTPTLYASQGYDDARLLGSALKQVDGDVTDREALRSAIRKADFETVRGKFAFSTNQHPIQNLYIREVVTLLGRNGMGKSTTVRSIMRLTPIRTGRITFDGKAIHRLPSYTIARLGIGLVPEGRQIFPNLTVHENMVATVANRLESRTPYTLDRVLAIFPRLTDRLNQYGNQLSGGEQQMLAVVRALMKLADRHCIMQKGRIVWQGATAALAVDAGLKSHYLGV